MKSPELDTLLAGARGVRVTLSNGWVLSLDREALDHPEWFRKTVWCQLGVRVPVYRQRDHDEIVKALVALAHADELSLVA